MPDQSGHKRGEPRLDARSSIFSEGRISGRAQVSAIADEACALIGAISSEKRQAPPEPDGHALLCNQVRVVRHYHRRTSCSRKARSRVGALMSRCRWSRYWGLYGSGAIA